MNFWDGFYFGLGFLCAAWVMVLLYFLALWIYAWIVVLPREAKR